MQGIFHSVISCSSMTKQLQILIVTFRYNLSCILKSLIAFIDSPFCVLVSLNFIVVGLEWVKKSSISLSKIGNHMSLHVIMHTLCFYTIRSEQYDVCTTKNPTKHDEFSLSMEIETKNHKISINLWHGVKNNNKWFYANIVYLVQDTTNIS